MDTLQPAPISLPWPCFLSGWPFTWTINTLKGKVTMIFTTHQIPRGLHVDEVIALGEHGARMGW
ncbi:MAG: hypothetical protein Q8M11_17980 [Sulfuritalea sp.]|nr:hypothetical protein [Sulfuritalea sp.]